MTENSTPKGWCDEDWDDYAEYLQKMSDKELEIELKFIEKLGKVKKQGKIIAPNQSFYEM